MVKILKNEVYKGRTIKTVKFANGVKASTLFMSEIGKTKTEAINKIKDRIDQKEEYNNKLTKSYDLKYKTKKIFYYKKIINNPAKYGGMNVTVVVYKHTNKGLEQIGKLKWNTASYKGEESEVLSYIKKKGLIKKGIFERGYYNWSDAEKYNIKISKI